MLKMKRTFCACALLAAVCVGCFPKPNEHGHDKLYERCSDFQIEWGEGVSGYFENIYGYKISDNCVIIQKGVVCFWCGGVTGFREQMICGTYRLRSHTYCR